MLNWRDNQLQHTTTPLCSDVSTSTNFLQNKLDFFFSWFMTGRGLNFSVRIESSSKTFKISYAQRDSINHGRHAQLFIAE
jgi:hypothetical protein